MALPAKLATAVVASALNYSMPNQDQRNSRLEKESWQKTSWQWFDSIGEFRYSCNWVGNLLSKAKLTLQYDGKPVTDKNNPAMHTLTELFGGPEGQAEMFRQLGIHMTVAGDSYIVCDIKNTGQMDDWFVAAASEITHSTETNWSVSGETFEDPLVIRVWRPHPKVRIKSDAPSRAVLPILAEIDGLTKHVAAQIDSRLASAGLLILPDDVTFPTQSLVTTDPKTGEQVTTNTGNDVDGFIRMLIETASTAIANRESASALVPIVIKVPVDAVDKIQHLSFWSGLDEKSIELRTEAIRRLALGMDMPPEVLTGTADMNHWSSWQVEEAAIKMHTEPLLQTIIQSLTMGYLRPSLSVDIRDPDELARYSFGVDTSKLRLRPNRSKEAVELYNMGQLSAKAMLRENGFDPEDAMGAIEFKEWLTAKVASGSTTPDLVDAALKKMGIDLMVVVEDPADPEAPADGTAHDVDEEASAADPTNTQEARPPASTKNHPVRELPKPAESNVSGLAASAEQIVLRALERAGNRIKSKRKRPVPDSTSFDIYQHVDMAEYSLDYLLEDAFPQCSRVAIRHGMSGEVLEHALDRFTRDLLATGKDFQIEELEEFLSRTPVAA